MMKAYVNYPNPHVTIHNDITCGEIQKQSKPNQRVVTLSPATVFGELQKFASGQYGFSANSGSNDLWLEVDLGNTALEKAVVNFVVWLLGGSKQAVYLGKPQGSLLIAAINSVTHIGAA